ncbi:40S ribosomal protein S13-like isoform X2 [Salvia splendens]|uniref:40S ribosomal protein S13-like isoform X2 n=1 Tax=Salvia splendens TaxID=180675 RepID=UPI001C2707DE|nr:40S ribosomal protein S13-like isoform X2 [Salvia splendens]
MGRMHSRGKGISASALPYKRTPPSWLNISSQDEKGMTMKGKGTKRESSSSNLDSQEPRMDIKSIMKDIEFLGSSHMTWKQKKDLENKKVVSLGGKPPKKQRLPLSVARVSMKNQKDREEKLIQERAILGRFGAYSSSSSKKVPERKPAEDRILKSMQGDFRKGVLNVGHLLQASNYKGRHPTGKGKKKKDGKKSHGKRKGGGGGGGKRRH